jgi:hypothetical protein
MTDDVTANFAANLQYSPVGTAGTMTVTYEDEAGATQNWPIIAFTPTSGTTKVLALGTGLAANVVLGESVSDATYDTADDPTTTTVNEAKSYTSVFPNETNSQNLKLKLSYTLTCTATGETITVTNATAEIPAKYLRWKPGFAYTYIFKISDNSNGSTGTPGTNPAGLYPITFDAVEVVAADGTAEYITTVSEPSITTFGVNNSGKYVTGGSEYAAGNDIYATFMEGSTVKTPVLSGSDPAPNVRIFAITYKEGATDSEKAAFPITEASVAETLANPAEENMIHFNNITTDASVNFTAAPAAVTTVPGEDGVNITINALKLTGVKKGTYAIEYEASAAWTGTYKKVYKVIVVQ